MFKKSSINVLLFFYPFLQGSGFSVRVLDEKGIEKCISIPDTVWINILSFCDFDTLVKANNLNQSFYNIFPKVLQTEIETLKKSIDNIDETIPQNFIAKKLHALDTSIKFQDIEVLNESDPNRANPLSSKDQHSIILMRYFIDQIIDKNCLSLSLDKRGTSSDYVAERLNLKNYALFYGQYCFRSLFPLTRCAFRHEDQLIMGFKQATYKEYIRFIDPYFKIKYTCESPYCYTYNNKQLLLKGKKDETLFIPFIIIIQYNLATGGDDFRDNPDVLKDFLPPIPVDSKSKERRADDTSNNYCPQPMEEIEATIKIQSHIKLYNAKQELEALYQAKKQDDAKAIQKRIRRLQAWKESFNTALDAFRACSTKPLKRFCLIAITVLALFFLHSVFLQKRFFPLS